MSIIDEILRAATLLSESLHKSDAQNLLLHHRQELQLAFDSIGRVLRSSTSQTSHAAEPSSQTHYEASSQSISPQDQGHLETTNTLSSAPFQQPEPSESLRRAAGQQTSNIQCHDISAELQFIPHHPENITRDEVSLFMEKLRRQHKAIHSFLNQNEEDAISKKENWMGEDDPRDVDILLSENRATSSQKFRGWLGRYLHAQDYLIWAEAKYSRPCTDFLVLGQKDADNKRQGHISEYLSVNNFNHSKIKKIHKSIKHGLKYHSIEHTYGNPGISALLCHMFSAFRDLSYAQLPSLARAIQQSPEWSGLANKKSNWLLNCRSIYTEECAKYREQRSQKHALSEESLAEQPPAKRVHLPNVSMGTASTEVTNAATADPNAELGFNGTSTNSLIHAELDISHCPDNQPADNTSSSNSQNLPRDFTSFQDFDPLQDYDIFQDFDPLQDWDVLQDPDFCIDTEEILKNSENLHVQFKNTTQMGPVHTGQEGESHTTPRRDGSIVPLSQGSISFPQPVV